MAEPNERLRTLTATSDGFAVAQKDLELRGAGEFFGTRQHGQPAMPALMLSGDGRMVARAREVFVDVMKSPERAQERDALLAAAARSSAQAGGFFGRN